MASRDRAGLVAQLRQHPQDAQLHLRHARLLAREAEMGRTDWRPAAAAFEVALQLDPTLRTARSELGRLYLQAGRTALAEQILAEQVAVEPSDHPAYAALAVAALREGHLGLALWSARHAADGDGARSSLAVAALTTALVDAADGAERMERLRAVDGALAASVSDMVGSWRRAFRIANAAGDANRPASQPRGIGDPPAQALRAAPAAVPAAAPSVLAPQPAAGPYGLAPDPGAGTPAASLSGRTVRADWRSCEAPAQPAASQSWSSGGSTTVLGPQPLGALPAPCEDVLPPAMAMIEAVIVRHRAEDSTQRGVNLLSALQVVATGKLTVAGDEGAIGDQLTLALPENGVTYLLNLFEDEGSHADVLAKPTLSVLDRTPSVFFSGATITVPVGGQFTSTLEEKAIGVSLAVTPTFVGDDEMLLAVNASRSFLEEGLDADLDEGIQTTTNTVTTNVRMRFGETLVLSGLMEREDETQSSATPGLGRAPIVGMLFSSRSRRALRNNVIVLLTPRRVTEAAASGMADDSLLGRRYDRRLFRAVRDLALRDTPEAAAADRQGEALRRADLLQRLPLPIALPR